jgi:hypothetical protein
MGVDWGLTKSIAIGTVEEKIKTKKGISAVYLYGVGV